MSLKLPSDNYLVKHPELVTELLSLVSQGIPIDDAVAQLAIPASHFAIYEMMSPTFLALHREALKKRADHWANKVIRTVDEVVTKEEAQGKKLQFEKLKWLAEMDNPDKYGKKTNTTVDIQHNIQFSVKNMSVSDAKKILNDDPFSIPLEADYKILNDQVATEAVTVIEKKEYSL